VITAVVNFETKSLLLLSWLTVRQSVWQE